MSKYDPEMRAFGSLKTECLRCNHWYPDGLVKCPKCGFEDTERRPRSMDPLRSRYSLIRARTILIVCPSAIQVQWKEEMRDKFGLEFRIVYDDLLADLRRRCFSFENKEVQNKTTCAAGFRSPLQTTTDQYLRSVSAGVVYRLCPFVLKLGTGLFVVVAEHFVDDILPGFVRQQIPLPEKIKAFRAQLATGPKCLKHDSHNDPLLKRCSPLDHGCRLMSSPIPVSDFYELLEPMLSGLFD
jgi:hypothetical protein